MASPRETPNSDLLEPLGPNFARKVVAEGAALEFYPTAAALYADIVRQPSRAISGGVTPICDVPLTIRRGRLLLTNVVLTLTAALDYASIKLLDLNDRNIAVLQAELFGSVVASGDFATGDDPKIGVGSVAASANPIATTAQDVITLVDFTDIVKDAVTPVAMSRLGATAALAPLLIADSAGNAIYLNASNTDTQLAADGTLTFNGYFDYWYVDLGNVSS